MDQLIELLKQIQDLAGVGIDALEGAEGGAPEKGAEGGEGAAAPDAEAAGGPPPEGPPPGA